MSLDNSKKGIKSILVKKMEEQFFQIQILFFKTLKILNLELLSIIELTSDKESAMDQGLAKCNKVHDIASYNSL